nr:hypothetical protein [Tanacetum cinerariifolium]
KVGVSPFADSAADASPFLSSIAGGPTPSNVFDVSAAPIVFAPRFCVADQIPVGVLFESTSMNLQEFFLDSDEEMPPGVSRVAAELDSDDEVVAEILFRGQSICGDRVVFVDTLSDDEIADPQVKVETFSESTSSPPLTRRKHLGERGEAFLCDRPELLPHVYPHDIQALRRKMNRHFRLNPDADDGLDLWRDVNMLCRSLHADDVEEFW